MKTVLKILILFSGAGSPSTTIESEILWDDGDAMAWDDNNFVGWD